MEYTVAALQDWDPILTRYIPLMPNLKRIALDGYQLDRLKSVLPSDNPWWKSLTHLEILDADIYEYGSDRKWSDFPSSLQIEFICCQIRANLRNLTYNTKHCHFGFGAGSPQERMMDPTVCGITDEFAHAVLRAFQFPFKQIFNNSKIRLEIITYLIQHQLVDPNAVNRYIANKY